MAVLTFVHTVSPLVIVSIVKTVCFPKLPLFVPWPHYTVWRHMTQPPSYPGEAPVQEGAPPAEAHHLPQGAPAGGQVPPGAGTEAPVQPRHQAPLLPTGGQAGVCPGEEAGAGGQEGAGLQAGGEEGVHREEGDQAKTSEQESVQRVE